MSPTSNKPYKTLDTGSHITLKITTFVSKTQRKYVNIRFE